MQGQRNNAGSPMNAQMSSPMGSPGAFPNYGQMPMFPNYPGYPPQFGYNPNQGYAPQQQPHQQQYPGSPAARNGGNYNQQYQNPALPTASTMSRSGSAISERPPSSMNMQSTQAAGPPAFQPPRKKGSSAIKIVNPNSKEEVILPRLAATSETKRDLPKSPAPVSIERPSSSDPNRPSSSSIPRLAESAEQKKAKQEAARQAVLDRVAASKAEEDKKAEAARAAKAESDSAALAKETEKAEQAAMEVRQAEEKERVRRSRAEAEHAKEALIKKAEEEQAAQEQEQLKLKQKAEADAKAKEEAAAEEKATAAKEEAEAKAAKESDELVDHAKALQGEQSENELPKEASSQLSTIAETAGVDQTADAVQTNPVSDVGGRNAADAASSETEDLLSSSDRKRPSHLRLDTATSPDKAAPSAMMTALRTSKRIGDISLITYPDGIKAPDAGINKNSTGGKFRYNKEFLLQFQAVYTEPPNSDWTERIKVAMGDSDSKPGKSSMGGRSSSNRGANIPSNPFGMTAFNPKPLKSSEDRFRQSEQMRAAGIDPATSGTAAFEPRSSMRATSTRKDTTNPSSPRTESKRGGKGGAGANTTSSGGRAPSNRPEKNNQVGAPTIAPEDVKPLANSGNRWTPRRAADIEPLPGAVANTMPPEMVQRKVKGLLNKLTLDNFDRITDQILEIASQSKDETDGRTLRQVIALTFEKATDEAHFSNMYARFCRKTMECTSDQVKDEGILDKSGNQVVGGTLFRKYLLSRCQEDFERGWKTDLPPKPDGEPETEEAAMLSDEYYIAAAAKRRGLGLVKFVGELFLMSMLNEKIMQECIKKLLANVTDPEEEEVESLSKLVETVGSALDSTPRGQSIMDVYMQRMEQLTTCDSLSSRIKFMVLDVIDLRKNRWVGSKTDKGPKTIQEIHDEAAQAAALKEIQRGSSHRGGGGQGSGRPDLGRGDVRNLGRRLESHGSTLTTADGWSTKVQTRAPIDFTKFGRFDKGTGSKQGTFGPGGNLSQTGTGSSTQVSRNPSHTAGQSREDSRTSQAPTNIFDALGTDVQNAEVVEEPEAEVSSGRPRLNLLPKGAAAIKQAAKGEDDNSQPSVQDKESTEPQPSEPTEELIPMPGDE